jgi:hypothetical protein
MAEPGKPTAKSFDASGTKEVAAGPLQWSDKCFLCGLEFGESDPRGFYCGTAAMVLCHRGCLNVMETHGGRPEDYHRAMAPKAPETAPAPPQASEGPSWLEFPDLAALQAYTKSRGDIPAGVKVTVAGQTVQGG